MPMVKIKEKYQVTLPAPIRREIGLAVGDLLEIAVDGSRITLTPKSVVDRELALALEDCDKGRFIGPYKTAKGAVRALRDAAR